MSDLINRADAIKAIELSMTAFVFDEMTIKEVLKAIADNTKEIAISRIKHLPSADAEPKMTEEVREALMRLTMCAREECAMCKYKDKCGFEFQYNISTENMNTLLDALSADAVQGEWVIEDAHTEHCSVCGYAFHTSALFAVGGNDEPNFCPNCGLRMKGGANK